MYLIAQGSSLSKPEPRLWMHKPHPNTFGGRENNGELQNKRKLGDVPRKTVENVTSSQDWITPKSVRKMHIKNNACVTSNKWRFFEIIISLKRIGVCTLLHY